MKWIFCVAAAIWPAGPLLHAQEKPLQISGVVSTGYYNSYTRDGVNQSISFVPIGARFNVDGFLIMPDFLTFNVQPELNFGPQASEAGFEGGNGVRLTTTFLRKRWFPVTFRYSNIQREDAYFGGLGQVSTYSLKSRMRDLGLTWELRPPNLPSMMLDWSKSSTDSLSGIDLIPDSHTHGNHVNLDSKYERWGWDFDGFAHHQHYVSDLFVPVNGGINTFQLDQTVKQYQAEARRRVWRDSTLNLTGGSQSTSSVLFNAPIDLVTRYANANLQITPKRRWKGSLRANYSSNAASQFLNQLLTGLAGTGPGTIAPDPSILAPLRQNISNLSFNATASMDLMGGLGMYSTLDDSQVLASSQQGASLNASYLTAAAGLTLVKRMAWGIVTGQYGREFGNGSVTGQSGTIEGQNYMATAQFGAPDRLQMNFSVRGSDQKVLNAAGFTNSNFTTEANVARRIVGNFSGRIGGGWQRGLFENAANQFRSEGYTARIGIEHPRFQVNASLNQSLGTSLPIYSELLLIDPTGVALISPLSVIPSDFRGITFGAHANPMRKVEFSATWTRSRQHLDGILNNDFQLLNIQMTYHFRRLLFDAGYIRSSQIFALYPETVRGRVYVRISRPVRIL